MTQASKYSGNMPKFIQHRKYTVVWFYDLEGKEVSYRFLRGESAERTEKLLKRGFTLKCDPFASGNVRLGVST